MSNIKQSKYKALLMTGILFFGILMGLHKANGAFRSEFGGHPDEAAHYVTGLMVHDYIAGLSYASPMKFAERYYVHYPKVAMGHWPPFFYVVQTAWTLLFSPSRMSMILMMSFLTTLLGMTVYLAVRKEFDTLLAVGVALVFIALPLIQKYSSMVMAEILIAWLGFQAVIWFGRFLDTENPRWIIGFTVFAVLAILTKGNGLALGLIPLLALLFSRRFYFLTRVSFWIPAVVVLIICGPWYWLTLAMAKNGMMAESFSLDFILTGIPFFSHNFIRITGIGLCFLILVGFAKQVVIPFFRHGAEGKWAAHGALVVGVWAFQSMVPASLENRHLIMAVPALFMFLGAGLDTISRQIALPWLSHKQKMAGLMVLTAVIFFGETFEIHEKKWYGFRQVAQQILSDKNLRQSVIMISSDERGEGMFVSEVAMQEHRPGHLVFRASKALARSRWSGKAYQVTYHEPEEIMRYLNENSVRAIVLDESVPAEARFEHQRLLSKTIDSHPREWQLSGTYPLTRDGILHPDGIKLYRLTGHEYQDIDKICVDLSQMLGKEVCVAFSENKKNGN